MSQKNQGNKQSESGEYKGHGKRPAERVSSIESGGKAGRDSVGSTPGHGGITFPIHNHPDKSVMKPGGA